MQQVAGKMDCCDWPSQPSHMTKGNRQEPRGAGKSENQDAALIENTGQNRKLCILPTKQNICIVVCAGIKKKIMLVFIWYAHIWKPHGSSSYTCLPFASGVVRHNYITFPLRSLSDVFYCGSFNRKSPLLRQNDIPVSHDILLYSCMRCYDTTVAWCGI